MRRYCFFSLFSFSQWSFKVLTVKIYGKCGLYLKRWNFCWLSLMEKRLQMAVLSIVSILCYSLFLAACSKGLKAVRQLGSDKNVTAPQLNIDTKAIVEKKFFSHTIQGTELTGIRDEDGDGNKDYIIHLTSHGGSGVVYSETSKTFSGDTASLDLGTYTISGTIEDLQKPANQSQWSFDLVIHRIPELNIVTQRRRVGETFSYQIQAGDIMGIDRGETATMTMTSHGGSGLTYNPGNRTFSRSTDFTDVASYTITGTISDGRLTENWYLTLNVIGESCTHQSSLVSRVIYGEDNRSDIFELCNTQYIKVTQSTVALISLYQLSTSIDGKNLVIQTEEYGHALNLCPEEPFYDQKKAAICSGFLVAPDIVITAGHCIESQRVCNKIRFVFGYGLFSSTHDPAIVKPDDVYSCQQLIYSKNENKNDYAVIKLDRNVAGRPPLNIRRSGVIPMGGSLAVAGHPAGLPTKVADGAVVSTMTDVYFVANLDTYGGNSGSAVFDSTSGVVEGILVAGETDYVLDEGRHCWLSNHCADGACSGERVTKITKILEHLPVTQ